MMNMLCREWYAKDLLQLVGSTLLGSSYVDIITVLFYACLFLLKTPLLCDILCLVYLIHQGHRRGDLDGNYHAN